MRFITTLMLRSHRMQSVASRYSAAVRRNAQQCAAVPSVNMPCQFSMA